ncbi:acyltransferase [Photobacterium lucens]|uniref:acyltransferase n=1 Tax=Photobacterium lucens TaxID=2562949 RepID=UPI0006B4430B|nr:acyltransferase family protein [Photobacterium lucens]KPA51057.1 fucose 4-O-acetylase [Photobacterium leiognathi subsp. mandapamensis]MBP2700018.1 acyltransferase family protein [Vibrio parahaemolyticus]MZG55371.1 fucose 4-O-acetylase [Photobacterium lucens]MZG82873.1 fucose 4-O-acetylase [Photobacterium lucens]
MSKKRIISFESGRLIALFAIIALHSQIFMKSPLIFGEPLIGMILNQASRFAVPLFFIMAGYFYFPKLLTSDSKEEVFWHYTKPLLQMWFGWSLIFLVVPFNITTLLNEGYWVERTNYWNTLMVNPINSLFEGGFVHLWYIPALVCAIGIITLLNSFKLDNLLLPIALVLFVYGCAAGSYVPLTDMQAPIFTRNGPFFSTLLVALGYEIHRRKLCLASKQSLLIAITGFVLFLLEANYLYFFANGAFYHDFLFGTPIWAIGIFLFLQGKPNFGEKLKASTMSNDMLGVYLCHFIVVIYFFNLVFMLEISPLISSVLAVPFAFIISLLIVKALRKLPFGKLLVR